MNSTWAAERALSSQWHQVSHCAYFKCECVVLNGNVLSVLVKHYYGNVESLSIAEERKPLFPLIVGSVYVLFRTSCLSTKQEAFYNFQVIVKIQTYSYLHCTYIQ